MSLRNFLLKNHPNEKLDQLVFENRNKSYGAYVLRRLYPKHMLKAMILSILLSLVLVFFKIIFDKLIVAEPMNVEDLVMKEYQIPELIAPQGKTGVLKKTSPDIATPVKEVKSPTKSKSSQLKVVKDTPVETEQNVSNNQEEVNENDKEGQAKGKEGTGDEIFGYVSNMPLFPGCENQEWNYSERKKCSDKKLRDFLKYNLKYPSQAIKNNTEGTVLIQFIVEKNGFVSDVKILQDIGDGCGAEARRVVEMMNNMNQKWTPGLQKGQHPVRVQYTLPVVFEGR
ncbi:MAG: TonB family protein [Saprospiraceae bacterium]|nr:TonB family protein [Saprospiraceae bacterium]